VLSCVAMSKVTGAVAAVESVTVKVNADVPAKVTGPALDATSNEVAIESLELTHEGISRA